MSFEFMEQTVDEICKSLETQPNRWLATTHTLIDQVTGIEYWSSNNGAITQTWNGRSQDTVFSYEQGQRIRESYNKMRQVKASKAQAQVLASMNQYDRNKGIRGFFARLFGGP